MARFVTESHMRHHPLADENDINQNHVRFAIHFFIF
jgi:hypothetical protein